MNMSILAALLAVYVLWGGTYLAMKVAIETMPPFLMAGVRFISAGLIVYCWQRAAGVPNPTGRQCRQAAVVGVVMLLGGNGSLVWAEQYVSSGVAAVVFATVPLWITLLSWLVLRESRPSLLTGAGLALGISGIILLVGDFGGETGVTGVPWIGYAALTASTLFWAAGSLYSRRAELPTVPLMGSALQMLAGGLACLLVGMAAGESSAIHWELVSFRSWLALGYLVLFGSIVGFSAYVWLLKVADPTLVTTNTYVNPVVAVVLGWLLADERMTMESGLAAVVILVAVVLIHKAGQRRASGAAKLAAEPQEG
ncbi:MAG TPA: EamA family transporter [Patescibacteria group bacterium]|nr:EamA family transporter [Patescibacteria group bacterium]